MNIGPQTKAADALHALKYRGHGEDFREAMNRVAFWLQDSNSHYREFREILLAMRFMPGGRIQTAGGSLRQATPYNCFVSGTFLDSFVDGRGCIHDRLREAGTTMRLGGGIGYDFSELRPRGDLVKSQDTQASGPVDFMRLFDVQGDIVTAAGHRHGAQMGILRVDHPDIEEFIRCKQNDHAYRRFNLSIAVTQDFMMAMQADKTFDLKFGGRVYKTIEAKALWEMIMRSTWDWGEPGVFFVDRVNYMNNLWYHETIAACNPCFTGDTKVWTAEGPRTLLELAMAGKPVQVLTVNGDGRFVYRRMTNIRRTRKDANLVEVIMVRGDGKKSVRRCTPQHEFRLVDGTFVAARDLKRGARLWSAYRRRRGSKGYLGLHSHACAMMEHHVPYEGMTGLGVSIDVHHKNGNKNDNRPSNLELLSHGAHSLGHIRGDRNPMRRFPERNGMLHGAARSGDENASWRDDLSTRRMQEMREGGSSFASIAIALGCSKYAVMHRLGWRRPDNHRIVSVRALTEKEDVFCGEVEDTQSFFIMQGDDDGVLVHNCGEQPLPPYGACLLGSFNLVKYIKTGSLRVVDGGRPELAMPRWEFDFDQLRADIPHVVRAMDNVVDRAKYPLAEQKGEAVTKRRMGLGVTGLANCIEALGYPYGSRGFLEQEEIILGVIRDECYKASIQLAREKGAFPLFDAARYLQSGFMKSMPDEIRHMIARDGIRNSHLTSIAPTGTISMCADNVSSGLEPVFEYELDRPVTTPEGTVTMKVMDYGAQFLGVRGRRASEVTAQEHVQVLAAAQRFVDSAVSKTINMDSSMPWDDFKDLYWQAWQSGCKSATTFNSDGLRGALLKKQSEVAPVRVDDLIQTNSACVIDDAGRRSCE